ncbi:RadC family protein [Simkania sp.]|uniref:RadC family protein n=1 Tax=Simkania sp. TaxID=34094 RepID=UPI003B530202
MTSLTKLPPQERPRERLLSLGGDALSLTELLAICLGSGRQGHSVLHLAEELIATFGSLPNLLEASVSQLTEVKGIGQAKALQLKAIFALAKRFQRRGGIAKFPVKCPKDAYDLIASYLEDEKQEKVALLFRNVKGEIFHHEIIASGTLSEVLVHPREVFHHVLMHRAFSFILVHNHPSGNPAPSKCDIELTRLVETSGRLMGIRLDDHLIIGKGAFVSLWEKGALKRKGY